MMGSDPEDVALLVKEGELARFRFSETAAVSPEGLAPNAILVQVEKFGLTANNVTYAALGRSFRYFDFFPAAEEGWGKVPVWGMGEVVDSRHPDLPPGARFYGYLPLARYATLLPARLSPMGFEVERPGLAAVYNQYALVDADPFHLPAREDHMLVFRPLFFTDFLLDDYLAEGHDYFGAGAVVISSASAKTSYGLAYMLARRRDQGHGRRCEVIGLTSVRHAAFVAGLGFYERIVTYDDLGRLGRDTPVVLVDVAGSAATLAVVRAHLGAALTKTVIVGMSHWEEAPGGAPANDPGSEFFFAPAWAEKRQQDWGLPALAERISTAWRAFMSGADALCQLDYGCGEEAVAAAYRALLAGEVPPERAHVLSLWEGALPSAP